MHLKSITVNTIHAQNEAKFANKETEICEQSEQLSTTIDTKSSSHAAISINCAQNYMRQFLSIKTSPSKTTLILLKLLEQIYCLLYSEKSNSFQKTEISMKVTTMSRQKSTKTPTPSKSKVTFDPGLDSENFLKINSGSTFIPSEGT